MYITKPRSILYLILISIIFCFSSCFNEVDILEVNPNALIFESGEGTQYFDIKTCCEWHIECDGLKLGFGLPAQTDWFYISSAGGEGDARITITTKEGTSNNITDLYVVSGFKYKIVALKQK